MLMREWRRGSEPRRRLRGRRYRALLMVTGLVLAGYSATMTATLAEPGGASTPWLPNGEEVRDFFLVLAVLSAIGFIGGFVYGVVMRRRERRLAPVQPTLPSSLDRGPSAYVLGCKWLFTGWRLWTAGPVLLLGGISYTIVLAVPDMREPGLGGISGEAWFLNIYASAWMIWALVLKGREVQRGKERIKVADEYLAIREDRLHAEFDAMSREFLQQQQAWQAEKTAQLYEQILDQQARGILPCPNCRDHGEHRKAA